MKRHISHYVVTAAAAMLASTALAQNPAPPQPSQQPSPPPQNPGAAPVPQEQESVPEVTETQLDTFTTIYAEMQQMNQDFQEELAGVESEEEAIEVQERLQAESTALIEEHDWSFDRYNQIAQAINAQPEVLQRALELIEEKS